MSQPLKIAVACGGTGGHVFPGLATAEQLRDRGHDVTLWLTDRNAEWSAIQRWAGITQSVKAAGFSSRISWRFVSVAWGLARAVLTCRRRMKENPPDVLLAMGSYASVGPVLGAWSIGVPIVLHEANAIPGRAITFLAHFSTCVAVAFSEAAHYLGRSRVEPIGVPLRQDLIPRSMPETTDQFTILVMGGSQGASRLNDDASQGLCEAFSAQKDFRVIHLTGAKDEAFVRARYEKAGVPCDVRAFGDDMGSIYAVSSLAVSRAGAGACFELAAWGIPTLFVALPSARRNHQMENALILKKHGGAEVVAEKEFSGTWLSEYVRTFRHDSERIKNMASAMRRIARIDATGRLADLVEQEGIKHIQEV